MAETDTRTNKNTDADKEESDEFIFNPKTNEYVPRTMSADLYKQQKKAQTRQATIAGLAGLGAEAAQFAVGASIFGDPTIKAAGQEKAMLAAEREKDPDYLTEVEKQARREAAMAPVARRAEATQRRAEAIAAGTGDVSVESILAAGEAGIAQMRQQALRTEAEIAKEDVVRQELKAKADAASKDREDAIDAMMLDLRNQYIREPLHKFIGEAGKVAGTLMAYAPARTIDDQIKRLQDAKVPPDQIAAFAKMHSGRPKKAKAAADEILAKIGPQTVETTKQAPADSQLGPEVRIDPSSGRFAGVEYVLGDDGIIRYKSPTTGETIPVQPGTDAYESIMKIKPEERVSKTPLTGEQARSQAEKTAIEAVVESAQKRTRGIENLESRVGQTYESIVESQFSDDDRNVFGNPTARRLSKYEKLDLVAPDKYDHIYKSGPYAFGFKDNVWTVYDGNRPNIPLTKNGKNVQFTMDEAKNKTGTVRDLYDLAISEGFANDASDGSTD